MHLWQASPLPQPVPRSREETKVQLVSGYSVRAPVSRNGGGLRELLYISLRYFTAETLCMMYMVHLRIINGFVEFTTKKNDYARTLHKGMVSGFILVFNSSACCKARKFVTNSYPGFFFLFLGG